MSENQGIFCRLRKGKKHLIHPSIHQSPLVSRCRGAEREGQGTEGRKKVVSLRTPEPAGAQGTGAPQTAYGWE